MNNSRKSTTVHDVMVDLHDTIERLENEVVAWHVTVENLQGEVERLNSGWYDKLLAVTLERDALRAELDKLKQQEPVVWIYDWHDDADEAIVSGGEVVTNFVCFRMTRNHTA